MKIIGTSGGRTKGHAKENVIVAIGSPFSIKDGGKYNFKACGEYVFVFDDNTGECINRIKV